MNARGASAERAVAGLLLVAAVAGLYIFRRGSTRGGADAREAAFARVAADAFGAGGALTDAWADVDGDGDPDRFVGFNGAPARLYRNDGDMRFTDVAARVGLAVAGRVRSAAWGDADLDGDPDLLLGFAGDGPVTGLYLNEGDGGFREVAAEAGVQLAAGTTRQAVWVDVDGDGDLDLFLALRDGPNRVWRNEGVRDGIPRFRDATEDLGLGDARRSVGAVWFDADQDGDLDVYVANMDGDANGMWVQEDGRFRDVAPAWGLADGGRSLGSDDEGTVRPCVADVDGDGDPDLATANYGPTGLFLNPGDGAGRWTPAAEAWGLRGDHRDDSCLWADVNHDGRPDLFVNGTVTHGTQYPDRLYVHRGDHLERVAVPALDSLRTDHAATWVDADGDGDVDLALTGAEEEGAHPLLRNLLKPEFLAYGLQVAVVDSGGRHRFPGAEVRIYAGGSRRLLAWGMVDAGSGYDGQSDLPVHLGLPADLPVDVEVRVPGGPSHRLQGVDPGSWRGRALAVTVR